MVFQGEENCNTPNFDLDIFEQNYVNDVNMVLWIPSEWLGMYDVNILFGLCVWLIMQIRNVCKYYVHK